MWLISLIRAMQELGVLVLGHFYKMLAVAQLSYHCVPVPVTLYRLKVKMSRAVRLTILNILIINFSV